MKTNDKVKWTFVILEIVCLVVLLSTTLTAPIHSDPMGWGRPVLICLSAICAIVMQSEQDRYEWDDQERNR